MKNSVLTDGEGKARSKAFTYMGVAPKTGGNGVEVNHYTETQPIRSSVGILNSVDVRAVPVYDARKAVHAL